MEGNKPPHECSAARHRAGRAKVQRSEVPPDSTLGRVRRANSDPSADFVDAPVKSGEIAGLRPRRRHATLKRVVPQLAIRVVLCRWQESSQRSMSLASDTCGESRLTSEVG